MEPPVRSVMWPLADIGIQQGADASLGRVDPKVDAEEVGVED